MIAPGRANRPHSPDVCPFDAGHEHLTPPETLRIGDPWQVRVVPNLYPAFERQEVVVHTPRHVESLAELRDDECARVAEAWQRRARDTSPRYLHALVNEGRAAGASLAHSHSQLVWLDGPPPEVRTETGPFADDLVIEERDGVQAAVAYAGRAPYELLIRPVDQRSAAFRDAKLGAALRLLSNSIARLRAIERAPLPLNAWLHDGAHWHLHVLPRLTVAAGIELGAGIYVNTLAPENAADALRGVAL